MLAIYKREVRSYLCSMLGCVMIAIILAFVGFFTVMINISGKSPNFAETLYNVVAFCVFVIVIPFVTMRSIAEERHSKTEQLLFSLPVPMYKTVLAKYFAMLTIVGIPLVIVGTYPLLFTLFAETSGDVNLAVSYNAWFLLALMLAAMVAIGMFASSLVENQIISAVISAGVFFLLFFIGSLASVFPTTPFASLIALIVVFVIFGLIVLSMTKNSTAACIATGVPAVAALIVYVTNTGAFYGLFSKILSYLAFFDVFVYPAYYGMFDIVAVVYYISVAAVFVFMTVESVERRRYN